MQRLRTRASALRPKTSLFSLSPKIYCHKPAFGGVCIIEKKFSEEFNTVMKNKSYFYFFLLLAIICLSSFVGFAQDKEERKMKQKEFCSGNWSGDDKISFHEAREMTVSPASLLTVDGKRNG